MRIKRMLKGIAARVMVIGLVTTGWAGQLESVRTHLGPSIRSSLSPIEGRQSQGEKIWGFYKPN